MGAVLTVEYGVYEVVGAMLFCTLMALAAALMVLAADRRDGAARGPDPA
ncbi:MAG: hypothetical protein RIE31_07930 [Alphaproteobacteria bacterium]